jgi:hypothetical protein
MFVSVDMDCYLNVTLTSENETVSETVTGFNKEKSLKEWKKIELEIENNFAGNAKLMLSRGRPNGKKEGYWAVDNIAFCRPSLGNTFSFNLFNFFLQNTITHRSHFNKQNQIE